MSAAPQPAVSAAMRKAGAGTAAGSGTGAGREAPWQAGEGRERPPLPQRQASSAGGSRMSTRGGVPGAGPGGDRAGGAAKQRDIHTHIYIQGCVSAPRRPHPHTFGQTQLGSGWDSQTSTIRRKINTGSNAFRP